MEYTKDDFGHSPFLIFWEVTRACDLVCRHCRASAHPKAHPRQLSNSDSKRLIDQIASLPKPPLLVLTGGDPMKREDIYDLIEYAKSRSLNVAITPSATDLVTSDAIPRLKTAGVSRFAMSIDGPDAATHDAFRGVGGSFERTLRIMADARAADLPIQVNTTITKRNFQQVEQMADLLEGLDIVLWSVFFLIPVGRGLLEHRIEPREYEDVFAALWSNARRRPFGIKTTEAHHYRRFVLQHAGNPQHNPAGFQQRIQRAPLGVNDGKGVMFVSHTGQVYPSGFMPVFCGRFPEESIVDVYQNSAIFQQLRNGDLLKGKCGKCEYRHICGGSRARAYAVTGDPLGSEPDCVYLPEAAR